MAPGIQIGDQRRVRLSDFQEIVGRAESGSFDGAGDVEHGEAFRHDDGVEVDVAAAQALLDINNVRWFVEEIFTGFQRASVVIVVPEDEGFFAVDYSGIFQFGCDMAGGVSRAEHHKRLPIGLYRRK